jgi:SAM-dependent methyltransferase
MSVKGKVPLYDALSDDYDRFVNWEDRLAYEMPFIEQALHEADARRVLDVACGTGMHVIELARRTCPGPLGLRPKPLVSLILGLKPLVLWPRDKGDPGLCPKDKGDSGQQVQGGYEVVGADLSAPMIERARENAAAEKVDIRFEVAGFGGLNTQVGTGFDTLLCLGNSLPHVSSAEALNEALADFAAVLRPGGLLLIQNRNFDAVLARRKRFMGPETYREGDREWLFVRFYDFNPDGTITFNMVVLHRDAEGKWSQQVEATRLRPLVHSELIASLTAAGFTGIICYGDMQGAPFDPDHSPNLVVTARRTACPEPAEGSE